MIEYQFDQLVRPIPEGPDWWSSIKQFPVKIIDQSFGYELHKSDMVNPTKDSDVSPWPRTEDRTSNTGHSWVRFTEDDMQVELSIPEFKVEKLDISIEKGFIVIRGEHEEREEGDGTTIRKFARRYMLPCNSEEVTIEDLTKYVFESNVVVKVPIKVPKDQIVTDIPNDSPK